MSRLTLRQIKIYVDSHFEEKWHFHIRMNHFVFGQFAPYAYHDPKKYPKDVDRFLETPEEKGKPMSPEKMLKVIKSLAGDYGDNKPKAEKK